MMTPDRLWLASCILVQSCNVGFSVFCAHRWLGRWRGLDWIPRPDERAKLLESCKQEIKELVVRGGQVPDWMSYQARVDDHFEWVGDRLRNQATVALALGLLCTLVYIAIVVGQLNVPEKTAEAKLASLLGETQHSLLGTLIGVVAHLIIVLLLYCSEHCFRGWSGDFMEALRSTANESRATASAQSPPFSSPSPSPGSGPPPNRPSAPAATYAEPVETKVARSSPTSPYANDSDSLRAVEGAMTDVHQELHRFPSALADEIEKTASKLGETFGREARHQQWETLDQTRRQISQLLEAADERDRKFINNMSTLVQELVNELSRPSRSERAAPTRPPGRRSMAREGQPV